MQNPFPDSIGEEQEAANARRLISSSTANLATTSVKEVLERTLQGDCRRVEEYLPAARVEEVAQLMRRALSQGGPDPS